MITDKTKDTVVKWIDERIKHMVETPIVFGNLQSVEHQIVTLLEVRLVAAYEDLKRENVWQSYVQYLKDNTINEAKSLAPNCSIIPAKEDIDQWTADMKKMIAFIEEETARYNDRR